MKVSPVSFGSLMVFTLEDKNKPSLNIPVLMDLSFENNPKLNQYKLRDVVEYKEKKIDGSVHNAATNFAEQLDEKYKSLLPKGSKDVILTIADFAINPRVTQKRYFLTAPTDEDEGKIHKILSKSDMFYTAKFNGKPLSFYA